MRAWRTTLESAARACSGSRRDRKGKGEGGRNARPPYPRELDSGAIRSTDVDGGKDFAPGGLIGTGWVKRDLYHEVDKRGYPVDVGEGARKQGVALKWRGNKVSQGLASSMHRGKGRPG